MRRALRGAVLWHHAAHDLPDPDGCAAAEHADCRADAHRGRRRGGAGGQLLSAARPVDGGRRDPDIKVSAKRIMFGKTLNAGQICLAPDYVIVHKEKKDEFISEVENVINEYYPSMKDNDDYSSIINQRHFDRINSLIEDAREKGADINQINPSNEDFSQQQFFKIPPTIVTNTSDDMKIMNEEIFGPVLPVLEYENLNDALSTINSKDKPLGLYYFGSDTKEENTIMSNTSSGGVTINNVVGHIQQKDLPFGGVGPSGMGRYQSFDGFKNFSNPRSFYKDVGFKFDKLFEGIRPPYTKSIEKLLKGLLK